MTTSNLGLLVACSPKSGSTYVSRTLARYLDANFADSVLDYYGYREQNLLEQHFTPELGPRFVLHLHIKPYPPHLDLIARHRLKVIYLWRNLADTILSLDDHIIKEHWETPAVFIDNGADYRQLTRDARHRFLIEYGLPWYISFYLSWRRVPDCDWLIRCKYEEMVQDNFAFFARILKDIGEPRDEQRLRHILGAPGTHARLNVGVVGRSVEGMSENNKVLLERLLIEYPQNLTELLYELPWWNGFRGRESAGG